ncbi:unnamed protein product, partial [Gongylonema pulchrum]|uniref:Dolichyl-P-Man:Man(5)GlcNAc(2)-PP-dolichol alpha-1,3-mannosyltransferase n=1 Tax=Gongylonema pulchrum TaxID=637853 RepID=A0A183ECN8_9BILA
MDIFSTDADGGVSSVDVVKKRTVRGPLCLAYWKLLFLDMFMPRGYPQSVSPDYLQYQIWDTVQAFASSMSWALATEAVLRGAGVGNEIWDTVQAFASSMSWALATEAVLRGAGVGNENASALAATVAWLLKDGLGMVTRILFAWLNSPYLDADCKQWRLVADIFNDLALSLDLVAPIFPHFFTLIVCFSSMLRAIVGVAGGATRTT